MHSQVRRFDIILVFLILMWLGYGKTLQHDFHFDDSQFVLNKSTTQNFNRAVEELQKKSPNFISATQHLQQVSDQLWLTFPNRSLTSLTFAWNYIIGGKSNRVGYHLTNLLLHLLNAIALFFILRRLLNFQSFYIPAFISALFVVHPLNSSSVTYILQRNGLLAACFSLLALLSYFRWKDSRRYSWLVISLLMLMAALSSKEISLMLLGVIFFYEVLFHANSWDMKKKTQWWLLGGSSIVLLGLASSYQMGLWSSGSATVGFESQELHSTSEQILTFSQVLVTYLRLWVFPFPQALNVDWDIQVTQTIWSISTGLSLLFHIIVIAITYFSKKRKYALAVFGMIWFYVAFLPYIVIPEKDILVEYKTYFPSIGLFLILAEGLFQMKKNSFFYDRPLRVGVSIICGIWLVLLLSGTIIRNQVYQTNLMFWKDVVKKSPNKPRAYHNLAVAQHYEKNYAAAVGLFLQTLELVPDHVIAHKNIGASYEQQGNLTEAISWYEKALKLDPSFVEAYLGLGNTYSKRGQVKRAIHAYEEALNIDSTQTHIYFLLAKAYARLNDANAALPYIEKFLEQHPTHSQALQLYERLQSGRLGL